jgi:hypothetical protein
VCEHKGNAGVFENLLVTQLIKKFPAYYGIQKVYYCVLKSMTVVRVLSQMNAIHTLLSCFFDVVEDDPPIPDCSEWSLSFLAFIILLC